MKRLFMMAFFVFFSSSVFARDTVRDYSLKETLKLEQSKTALGNDIEFYFGNQFEGQVIKSLGTFKTNKKTNAFNKTDKEACEWVFLSAMLSLKERAILEGGNAVINIKSNYKDRLTTSNTTFQCGSGAIMAGVALVGTVVKIEKGDKGS